MTTTTVLARNGTSLSRDVQIDGWYAYINDGGYTSAQQDALTDALMQAQRDDFNALLPEGCSWYPSTSEIIGPVGVDLGSALDDVRPGRHEDLFDDVMEMACEQVIERFEQIERDVLGEQ